MGLAMGMAKENSVPVPVSAVVEQGLLTARASGLGEKGVQSVIVPLEKLAGVEVRAP
jgi:3-hydroxyisobutyrate dehydrogenase-like beta-hydroxyacid dehydrogenase